MAIFKPFGWVVMRLPTGETFHRLGMCVKETEEVDPRFVNDFCDSKGLTLHRKPLGPTAKPDLAILTFPDDMGGSFILPC